MSSNYRSVADIEEFKARLLHHVVSGFAKPEQGEVQASMAVHKHTNELPFPSADNLTVNGGSLTFLANIGEHELLFSAWYLLGEFRIGVRLPGGLLNGGMTADKISKSYSGSPCSRTSQYPKFTFFDWVFDSGFASYETATKALNDEVAMIAVASRITDIMTHLYMSVMNILIEGNNLKVTFKEISISPDNELVIISVSGDFRAFEYWIEPRSKIHKKSPQNNNIMLYRAEIKKGTIIPKGLIVIQGESFVINDVVNMPS